MDIVLLAITIVSLVVALVMSVVAWRASRDERARSAARVAALAAAARLDQPAADTVMVQKPIVARPVAAPPRPAPWNPPSAPHSVGQAEQFGDSFLGSAVAVPPSGGRQRGLAIAASLLFVVVVVGGYFSIYGGGSGRNTTEQTAASASPLELISLRHERRNSRLAITGLVRNPNGGTAVEKLAAVVFLFDQRGAFVTSSRADVDFTQLTPGDESPFVINVDAPNNVARYRVSFRTDAGVVPHVDRRGQEPIARDVP